MRVMNGMFLVLAIALVAAPTYALSADVNKQLAAVRQATKQYHDVDAAIADGYVSTEHCASLPGTGGMGIHYVNPALIFGTPDQNKPSVLLYEPMNGKLKLVAVEYLYPAGGPVPEMFGQELTPMAPHDGVPFAHNEMHVWLWEANPLGMFEPWNPNVKCPEI
jgi:hypothetical protein